MIPLPEWPIVPWFPCVAAAVHPGKDAVAVGDARNASWPDHAAAIGRGSGDDVVVG